MHRFFLTLICLFAVASVTAQTPPPPVPQSAQDGAPKPNPVIPPAPVSAMPPAPQAAPAVTPQQLAPANPPVSNPAVQPAPTPGEEMIRMQYPNSDVKEVLGLYERLTGKRIVTDNTIVGPVNIVISSPVPRSEAIKIIEINLLLNGFSLVPSLSDSSIIKVIGVGKSARSTGVPIYSDINQIPDGERIISFLFKLQYAEPQELQQTLSQYIQQGNSTAIVPLQKSQTILITENTSVIRAVAKIIHEIDIPPAEVVSDFIPLERADAKDVIEKLEKIFEKTQTQNGAAPRTAIPNQPLPIPGQTAPPDPGIQAFQAQVGGLSEESIIIGKIKLTADIRTNRIHVITRPVNLPFVRKLIHEFDSNIPFGEPAKRPLKFISAADVLDVLVKSITEPGMKAEESGGSSGGTKAQPVNNNSSSNLGTSSSTGGSGMNTSDELSTQPVDTTPKAVTIGNTKIISDPRENTIIVLGNKEVEQKIFKLLDEIDVRAPQVMLNTVIGELTLNDDKQFGVDYLLRPKGVKTSGTSGISLATLASNYALTSFTGAPFITSAASALSAGNGITGVISPADSLDIIVNALESTGRFHVTQRPMVFTSNNKKAVIASGEEIAVPTQTLSNVNNGAILNNTASVSSSVEYKQVELKLEVVPLINSDREVSLDIVQTLNSDSGKSTNVGGSTIPTITTRYIKTSVSVPNRGTVVLGGLIKKNIQNGTSGVPVLSRIPVLGYLFKSTTKNSDREELIILIRPVVTTSPEETLTNSDVEQHRMLIEPDVESTISAPKPKGGAKLDAVNFR